MHKKQSFEAELRVLESKLREGSVAPRVIRRTLAEVRDHFADLKRECGTTEARARIGSAEIIAEDILARPELRSWGLRWPWMVFLIGPALAWIGLLFCLPAALIMLARITVYVGFGVALPDSVVIGAAAGISTAEYLYAPIVVAAFCLYGARRNINRMWLIAMVTLLASASYALSGYALVPHLPVGAEGAFHGDFVFGVRWSSDLGYIVEKSLKKIVPCVVAGLTAYASGKRVSYV